MTPWQHAAATILHIDSTGVTINCPHCGGEHHHGRAVLGSHHVVAGCHTGFRICREYAIPNPGGKR